jgi:hypothetical protein
VQAKLDAGASASSSRSSWSPAAAGLDLDGLLADPYALARVPVFLLAPLLVRGLTALPLLPRYGVHATSAAGLLQATSQPFTLTATQIGVATLPLLPVTPAAPVTHDHLNGWE